ncbi:MAG: hypothetical protein HUU25_11535 [Candidatus Sumerlaeia bacterium]|nr:hypothetical protein [Candidatus Sumerlaeia bacterium]
MEAVVALHSDGGHVVLHISPTVSLPERVESLDENGSSHTKKYPLKAECQAVCTAIRKAMSTDLAASSYRARSAVHARTPRLAGNPFPGRPSAQSVFTPTSVTREKLVVAIKNALLEMGFTRDRVQTGRIVVTAGVLVERGAFEPEEFERGRLDGLMAS